MVKDGDGDGIADCYTPFAKGWGVTPGSMYEFIFVTHPDRFGNVYTTLTTTFSVNSQSYLRGWLVQIDREGTVYPYASGIRSAGGIGYDAQGRIYFTDNQGNWNGTCYLKHVKPGSDHYAPPSHAWRQQAMDDLRSADDPTQGLWHPVAYYTLNEIPVGH